MCKQKEENSLKERQGLALICLMKVLTVLILCVIVSVFCNSCASRSYRQEFNKHIKAVINMEQDKNGCCNKQNGLVIPIANDAAKGNDTYVLIKKSYLKDILQQHITDHSNIMDTNNSLTIILTLITLCISLAAIIPYIMGKSILKTDIRNAVEEMHESETVKYQKLVDQLERSEAHLSRMTAYNLLIEYKLELNKCDACCKRIELNLWKHPYWVIGWASKAIIRYLKCHFRGVATEQFINDCTEYITESRAYIKGGAIGDDKDGVILRAFVDLFDALQLGRNNSMLNKPTLNQVLKSLWVRLIEIHEPQKNENTEIYIFNQVKKKAIYKEYMVEGSNATEQDFLEYFNEWKRENLT